MLLAWCPVNPLAVFFVSLGSLVLLLSLCVNGNWPLSVYTRSFFLYGKAAVSLSSAPAGSTEDQLRPNRAGQWQLLWLWLQRWMVPKRWFLHFYLLGAVCWLGCGVCWLLGPDSAGGALLHRCVSLVTGGHCGVRHWHHHQQQQEVEWWTVSVALMLFTGQVLSRLYEHLFVLVEASSRMHACHYVAGLLHYTLAPLALLATAPSSSPSPPPTSLTLCLCVLAFVAAWREQRLALAALANLRRTTSRHAVTSQTGAHALPTARWFSVVACPHYTAEVAMYACVWLLLGRSLCWGCVLYWVTMNQTGAARMTLSWYRQRFPGRPVPRYALVPYLL